MASRQNNHSLKPRLTLRIGFAGNRKLPANSDRWTESLRRAFELVGRRLAEIAPGTSVRGDVSDPHVAAYFSEEAPLLRLVTGLAEGADYVAGATLDGIRICDALGQQCLQTELAAVIPFAWDDYLASRDTEWRKRIVEQAERCSYILELDGIYDRSPDHPSLAKARRGKSYNAQSEFLLRQSDLIIAVADRHANVGIGGTMETVRSALGFNLPVLFIDIEDGAVQLLEPGDDWVSAMTLEAGQEDDWKDHLASLVTKIVADPDVLPDGHDGPVKLSDHGDKLLREFFDEGRSVESAVKEARSGRLSKALWVWFAGKFKEGQRAKSDPKLKPFSAWRERATQLNYHYAGLYRGVFLLNSLMAIAAVSLAALSLVLLGKTGTPQMEICHEMAASAELTESVQSSGSGMLYAVLLLFGLAKLALVVGIYRNTHRANHEDWNDRAVDYRYLAERLRAMYYLPQVGSFQPPAAAAPQYASRVVRQSSVDWLFDAIVRASPPAEVDGVEVRTIGSAEVRVLRPDAKQAVMNVRDHWIREQFVYHAGNALKMSAMYHAIDTWGKRFNKAVIGFVALDILILGLELSHDLPKDLSHVMHGITPWLVFLAAVLPAVVAGLNGVRFQSECQRLAERSAVMRVIMGGRSASLADGIEGGRFAAAERLLVRMERSVENTPGAWSLDALRFTEKIANDFVQEVAEWSVLYAKEVAEP